MTAINISFLFTVFAATEYWQYISSVSGMTLYTFYIFLIGTAARILVHAIGQSCDSGTMHKAMQIQIIKHVSTSNIRTAM